MDMRNTPVALIFFTRSEQFKRVFEEVRKAKPNKLFLIQDGARSDKDREEIARCREIADTVDWECEVHKNYSDVNLGCGQRIFSGLSWAFQYVDRLIILEDDCLPSPSFFPFCDEILEKYKNDDRIGLISGMNHLGEYDQITSDYLFSYVGSIAGWATWKRCWDQVDFQMRFLKNPDVTHALQGIADYGPIEFQEKARVWEKKLKSMENGEKQRSWSYQFGITVILNSQLIVVPQKNLMKNIGNGVAGTNTPANVQLVPKQIQRIYHLPLFQLEFPLRHPTFTSIDYQYNKLVTDIMNPRGINKVKRKTEVIWRRLRYGGISEFAKASSRKIRKKIGK